MKTFLKILVLSIFGKEMTDVYAYYKLVNNSRFIFDDKIEESGIVIPDIDLVGYDVLPLEKRREMDENYLNSISIERRSFRMYTGIELDENIMRLVEKEREMNRGHVIFTEQRGVRYKLIKLKVGKGRGVLEAVRIVNEVYGCDQRKNLQKIIGEINER